MKPENLSEQKANKVNKGHCLLHSLILSHPLASSFILFHPLLSNNKDKYHA